MNAWRTLPTISTNSRKFASNILFPDEQKSGGTIIEVSGKVKKISATDGTIVMADGCVIPITDVIDIVI